jgi:hypothetical protein
MTPSQLYRVLLRLYPAPFRREYGQPMTELFRELDHDHRNRRIAFWSLVVRDFVKSVHREHRKALLETMDAPWPAAFAVGAVVGTVLFFGSIRGISAVMGRLPALGTFVLKGALIGGAVGWAQYVTVGQHLGRRWPWLIATAAAGVAGLPAAIAMAGSRSAGCTMPPDVELTSGVAMVVVTGSLVALARQGGRNVTGCWMRMNAIALPTVMLFEAGLLVLLDSLRSWGDAWSGEFLFCWWVSNPVVIAVGVGAVTARPLWRMASGIGGPPAVAVGVD